jgi:hypothetical protein
MSSTEGATETIDFDLPCVGCAYNLRMQAADARCPECGLALADTCANSPYKWEQTRADRVAAALGLMAAANALVAVVSGLLLLMIIYGGGGGEGAATAMWLLSLFGASILHLCASRLLTLPPSGASYERFDFPLRAGIVAGAAAVGMLGLVSMVLFAADPGQDGFGNVGFFVGLFAILLILLACYVGLLARRLKLQCRACGFKNLALAARCTISPVGTSILVIGVTTLVIGIFEGSGFDPGVAGHMIEAVMAIGFWGVALFWIPATIVLFLLRRRFAQVAHGIGNRATQGFPPAAECAS